MIYTITIMLSVEAKDEKEALEAFLERIRLGDFDSDHIEIEKEEV